MQSTKTTIILTTAILILTLLTAGCTDTGGANPETTTYTPPPEEVPVVEETAAAEPVPEPAETHWYDDRPDYNPAVIDANDNLFGVEIDGIKYDHGASGYTFYNENQDKIFEKSIFIGDMGLEYKLSSDQYRTLIDQYGSMISVTMETIDLDQDGAMDKVAVKYVGTDGEWTEEFNYHDSASLRSYIEKHIEPSWYPHLSLN